MCCQELSAPVYNVAVGDAVSSDVLKSGAAFLFQFFIDKKRVTATDTLELRKMFGCHSSADAQAICDLVQR